MIKYFFVADTTEKQRRTSLGLDWSQWVIEKANEVYDAYDWKDFKPITLFNITCTP